MGKWLNVEKKHIHDLAPDYMLFDIADGSRWECDCGEVFVVKKSTWIAEKDIPVHDHWHIPTTATGFKDVRDKLNIKKEN